MSEKAYQRPSARGRALRKAGVLLFTLGVVVCLMLAHSKLQQARRFAGYEQIVSLVRSEKLRADSNGDIWLPDRLASLTENGHIYQAQDQRAGLVLLCPTKVSIINVDWGNGKIEDKRQIAGYVYCSGPLPNDGWLSFTGLEDVRVWQTEPIQPHWFYAEPFYSD